MIIQLDGQRATVFCSLMNASLVKKKVLIKKISANKSIFNIGEREVDEVIKWTLENADNIY